MPVSPQRRRTHVISGDHGDPLDPELVAPGGLADS